ncbi:hypothetical protein [Nocardia terpenica]|uniref:Uncharacterized protein n=1 Tax=Nocardia terpenica TaxID=455432 RepID=A0A6G9YVH4_9NOCA|nr:hypothetical protein [Nocardia terpenica]QIS17006.1 hypothetical protein F6W96_00395 [Nocardia terpenica]
MVTTPAQPSDLELMRPQTLGRLAEDGVLSMADVSYLAKVSPSTLSRLWNDDSWLERVSGATLQQLIGVVPGLAEYVTLRSYANRLTTAARACGEAGIPVRVEGLRELLAAGCSAHHVSTALEAAHSVMRLDVRAAVLNLSHCWGNTRDAALEALFVGPGGLLIDPHPLIAKAMHLVDILVRDTNSLHATMGYGILVHKLTKLTGAVPADVSPAARKRSSAFTYRSGVIGILLHDDDVDAAEAYRRSLDSNPLLRRNELWSMATYCSDIPPTLDFSLPTKGILWRTTTEIVQDIRGRNDAYLHYLLTAAIPVMLEHDPTFGQKRPLLVETVRDRLDRDADRRTRRAGSALVDLIGEVGSG